MWLTSGKIKPKLIVLNAAVRRGNKIKLRKTTKKLAPNLKTTPTQFKIKLSRNLESKVASLCFQIFRPNRPKVAGR